MHIRDLDKPSYSLIGQFDFMLKPNSTTVPADLQNIAHFESGQK